MTLNATRSTTSVKWLLRHSVYCDRTLSCRHLTVSHLLTANNVKISLIVFRMENFDSCVLNNLYRKWRQNFDTARFCLPVSVHVNSLYTRPILRALINAKSHSFINSLHRWDFNYIPPHCYITGLCPKGDSQLFYRHVCTNFYKLIIFILHYNDQIHM